MSAVAETLESVRAVTEGGYKWGFSTDIEMDLAPKGLNEDTIRLISARKQEPAWLLEWRLRAFSALEDDARAALGDAALSADRLSGCALLRRAEEEGWAAIFGRGRSRAAAHV
ncbi:MAG: hypothetical protein WDN04_09700 [Rhodospirillales bacterium]